MSHADRTANNVEAFYAIAEFEPLDTSARAAGLPAARKVIEAANGQSLRTTAGRVVQIEGAPAPKSVGITEWPSVDEAVAFYKSKAWTDTAPQRDKFAKVIRRYMTFSRLRSHRRQRRARSMCQSSDFSIAGPAYLAASWPAPD